MQSPASIFDVLIWPLGPASCDTFSHEVLHSRLKATGVASTTKRGCRSLQRFWVSLRLFRRTSVLGDVRETEDEGDKMATTVQCSVQCPRGLVGAVGRRCFEPREVLPWGLGWKGPGLAPLTRPVAGRHSRPALPAALHPAPGPRFKLKAWV